jgi:hypothetical protein
MLRKRLRGVDLNASHIDSSAHSGFQQLGLRYIWIVETDDLETARRLASAGSRACNRRVELRPFLR